MSESSGSIAVNAVGDQPTSEDSLGFTPYVEAIARFLAADATRPPITISIEGEWGSGKSSFLLQLEHALGGGTVTPPFSTRLPKWLGGIGNRPPLPPQKTALTVRFNAWRHDKQDALWAAFALAFVKSLRRETGMLSAWLGDISLFMRRLNGVRAWFELSLLLISFVAFLFGIIKLSAFVSAHPGDIGRILDWLSAPSSVPKSSASPTTPGSIAGALHRIASYGTFGSVAAIGAGGLYKFHSYIKMPLSLKLEKYISKPDYEGHASFIENFHIDLNRLIEAYAGSRRIFIFIDDLDRCDVPRAADLMQAINLMIGD